MPTKAWSKMARKRDSLSTSSPSARRLRDCVTSRTMASTTTAMLAMAATK
jgi:hypothetical protein